MEGLVILLALPVSFVSSAVYSIILKIFIKPNSKISILIFWTSSLVLFALSCEVISVVLVGPVGLAKFMGFIYYWIHLGLFFLAVPSLVNILALQERFSLISKWYVAATASMVLAYLIILLQYYVTYTSLDIRFSSN